MSTSYSDSLAIDPTSSDVTITNNNGSTALFYPNSSGSGFTAASWNESTLAQNNDGSYTYTLPNQETETFNSLGQLTSETDLQAETTNLTYTNNQLTTITAPSGRSLTLTYNSNGQIATVTDPMEYQAVYTYDSAGDLTQVTDPGGRNWNYTYDSQHELLTIKDPNGNTVLTNTYNSSGQITQQVDGLGNTTSWAYSQSDANDTETVITLPNDSETYEYFTNNLPVETITDAGTSLASTTTASYDDNENPTQITDGNGNTSNYEYDNRGNLLSFTNPEGNITTYTYNADNNITSTVKPSGDTINYTYDSHNNLTSETQIMPAPEINLVTSYTFDNSNYLSLPTSLTNPDGNTTTYAYDSAGDLVSKTDPMGNEVTYGYDLDGRQTSVTSPKGNVTGANPANFTTNTTLNAVGQPLTVTDPLGNVTTYTYDLDGNKTSVTDPDGNMTSYTYNENNQPLTTNRANGSTLLTSYDSMGNVETQTDGAGNVTSYAYNSMNELESSTTPMGEVASYSYDSDGNVLTKIDPSGDITTNTYDIDNELTSVGYSDGATPGVAYSYTPDGLVSTMTDGTGTTAYSYDSADRLISVTNGNGKTVSYGLDSDGNTTTLTYPNNKQVSQVFNNDDQLSSVTDWLSHTTHFNYDPNSNWTSTNYPDTLGTVDTNTYNNSDELTSISDQQGSNVLWSASYSLDANGQVTTADNTGSPAPTPSNAYGYNTLNQLDSNNSNNYAYDSSDNPTTINGNSGYNYNSDNELTTGPTISSSSNTNYSYNANGELTGVTAPTGVASPTNYSYDQMGNMTTVSRAKADGLAKIADSYTYDGNGLRQSETIGSTTKQLTWDQSSSVPSLLADGSTSIIYGPDSLPIEQVTGTTPLYYHHDQQGSTVMLTSQAGTVADSYSYDPAGNLLASNGTTKPVLGYDASLTDWDVGLVYLQARVYDPTIDQFLTRDPLDSLTGQAYEYAGDDPVNNSDPSGLCFVVSCNVYHSVGGVVKSSLVTGSNAFVAGSKFVSSHTTAITVATGISCVLAPEFCAEVGSGALITEATANDVLAIRDPNSAKACLVDDGKDAVDEGLSILPSLSGEIEGEDGTFEPALPKTITRYLNGLGGTAATLLNGIQDRSNGACGCGG